MEKNLKTALLVVISLLAVNFIVTLFIVSPAIRSSIRKLEETKLELDSAKDEIRRARESVDSLQTNLLKFGNYVINIQAQAELNRKEREVKEGRYKTKRDSIQQQIDSLRTLADTIHLPIIEVYDSRKK
jgi:chromosome segregation ATPase